MLTEREAPATAAARETKRRPPLLGVALTLAGVAVLAGLTLIIEPLRDGIADAVRGDTEALRSEIRGADLNGVPIVLLLAIAHAVVWYPTEILNAATGFVYGFWAALPLMVAGWTVNALLCYWIGRHAARPLLHRVVGEQRFERLERVAERGGVTLLLAMRLVPIVPFSLFSIAGGAAHVPLGRFLWTSAVGFLPMTALFVYLGSQLEGISVTDPGVLIGAVVLIALLLLTRRLRDLIRDAPENAR